MENRIKHIAETFFKRNVNELGAKEKGILERVVRRIKVSHDTNTEFDSQLSYGQRLADKVATFGGSWTFIIIFIALMISWVIWNSYLFLNKPESFDPFPYILMNLFLSMTAAIQAPIILMAQNRQSSKDRLDATHDYEVNLKSELEILGLHEKLDDLRETKWQTLLETQQQQIELLTKLLADISANNAKK